MGDVRIIKKYPNRRLYDTKESRYITLNDIRRLVIEEESFDVIDKKTSKNITRSILLHVIADREDRGQSPMSQEFLTHVIRAYSGTLPQTVRAYLQQSLNLFLEQHRKAGKTLNNAVGNAPLATLAEIAQDNLSQWLELQKHLLRSFQGSSLATQPNQGNENSAGSGLDP